MKCVVGAAHRTVMVFILQNLLQ